MIWPSCSRSCTRLHRFPGFPLAHVASSGAGGAIAKAYGVPLRVGLAKRVTFVIDRQGKISKVFPDVNPTGHASEILAAPHG